MPKTKGTGGDVVYVILFFMCALKTVMGDEVNVRPSDQPNKVGQLGRAAIDNPISLRAAVKRKKPKK